MFAEIIKFVSAEVSIGATGPKNWFGKKLFLPARLPARYATTHGFFAVMTVASTVPPDERRRMI